MERRRCQIKIKDALPRRKATIFVLFDMIKPAMIQIDTINKNTDVVNK
jgi:hypothetical protein